MGAVSFDGWFNSGWFDRTDQDDIWFSQPWWTSGDVDTGDTHDGGHLREAVAVFRKKYDERKPRKKRRRRKGIEPPSRVFRTTSVEQEEEIYKYLAELRDQERVARELLQRQEEEELIREFLKALQARRRATKEYLRILEELIAIEELNLFLILTLDDEP